MNRTIRKNVEDLGVTLKLLPWIGDSERKHPRVRIGKSRAVQLAAMPGDIEQTPLARHALEKFPPTQGRVPLAKVDEPLREGDQIGVCLH